MGRLEAGDSNREQLSEEQRISLLTQIYENSLLPYWKRETPDRRPLLLANQLFKSLATGTVAGLKAELREYAPQLFEPRSSPYYCHRLAEELPEVAYFVGLERKRIGRLVRVYPDKEKLTVALFGGADADIIANDKQIRWGRIALDELDLKHPQSLELPPDDRVFRL